MGDQRKLRDILKDLGESSSLHGIPKVMAPGRTAVKILWGILLCGAIVLFSLQFVKLQQEYYSYPVKTSVSLQFARLRFPDVTVCNMNPVRKSALLDPDNIYTEKLFEAFFQNGPTELAYEQAIDNLFVESENDDEIYDIDSLEIAEYNKSHYDKWKTSVLAEFKDTDQMLRQQLGHQMADFIRQVKFSGFKLSPYKVFHTKFNSHYGNCYTANINNYAMTTGQDNGLTLELDIEISEYLDNIAQAYGAKIVIHKEGTYPLPDRDGLVLNPGFETNIGMKMVRVQRLGGVYGDCVEGRFYEIDGIEYTYTTALCHAICESDMITNYCGCSPTEAPFIDDDTPTCNSSSIACVITARTNLHLALSECNCPTPCHEESYVTTATSRAWPVQKYLEKVLLTSYCKQNNSITIPEECLSYEIRRKLTFEEYLKVSKNFIKVNIYFEDLNFNEISEEPLYNTIRFLSDIGGMMGLFMGASMLTFVELLQLILEVVLFLKRKVVKGQSATITNTKVKPLN